MQGGWLDGVDIFQCIFHDFLLAGLENRLADRERRGYAIRKEYWERETNIGRRERCLQAMGSRMTIAELHPWLAPGLELGTVAVRAVA